jgi:large subunit ribosomal protein L24
MGVGHRLAVKKNDLVEVIAGKDKGKRGKVLRVLPKLDKVLAEKINFVKRHTKPGGKMGQRGGIVERENPLPVSNVQLVCGKCDRPVRVGRTELADGRRVRVCRECGETMD